MSYEGQFIHVNALQAALLERAFPNVDLAAHLARMDSWLYSNPHKRPKRNMDRFIHSWLSRHLPQKEHRNVERIEQPPQPLTRAACAECPICKRIFTRKFLEKYGGKCGHCVKEGR